MNKKTKTLTRAYLIDLIDKELQKPLDEQDMDFIEKCDALLEKIDDRNYEPDPVIVKQKLDELNTIFSDTRRSESRRSIGISIKRVVTVSCALLIVFSTIVLTAAAIGNVDPLSMIREWSQIIFDLPYDEPTDVNGLTFIKHGNVTYYDDIEEMLRSEGMYIIYPKQLPDGIILESVMAVEVSEGTDIELIFNKEVTYLICMYDLYGDSIENLSTEEDITIGDITYYISSLSGRINATFFNNGYTYSISANDKKTLLEILEELSELPK